MALSLAYALACINSRAFFPFSQHQSVVLSPMTDCNDYRVSLHDQRGRWPQGLVLAYGIPKMTDRQSALLPFNKLIPLALALSWSVSEDSAWGRSCRLLLVKRASKNQAFRLARVDSHEQVTNQGSRGFRVVPHFHPLQRACPGALGYRTPRCGVGSR